MRYFIKPNGSITKDYTKGYEEVLSPIREDGTLLPKHKNLGNVTTKEDGSYYSYYLQDGTPDLVAIDAAKVESDNQAIYAELEELDKASIRDIREWIASQPLAPQTLKDRENAAIVARGNIR